MNRYILVSATLIVVALLCSSAGKQRLYRINVSTGSNIGHRFIDSFWLENEDADTAYELAYDEQQGSGFYRDSLPKGRYSLYMRDILGDKHKAEFQLKKDTSLSLPGINKYHIVPMITIAELQQAEHVEVVWLRSGCYQFDLVKAFIKHNDDGKTYTVKVVSNSKEPALYSNQVPATLLNSLHKMQEESRDAVALHDKGAISTNTWHLYLFAGNKVFRLIDQSGEQELNPFKAYILNYMNQSFGR